MIKFLNEKEADIRIAVAEISARMNIPPALVEKDMWICYLLDYLFNRCEFKSFFEFKGGTSLSKMLQGH